MIRISGPDGVVIEFPEGTAQDTITAVMRQRYGGPSMAQEPATVGSAWSTALQGAAAQRQANPALATAMDRMGQGLSPQPPGMLASGLGGLAQGLTFGLADEMAAGLRAGVDTLTGRAPKGIGAAYDARLPQARAVLSDMAQQNPWTYGLSQLGGAVATAPFLPGATVAQGAGLAARAGAGAGVGAAYGGVVGFNEGEGGFVPRAANALGGAALGAALGGAAAPVIDGVSAAARGAASLVGQPVSVLRGAASPQGEATQRVRQALMTDARRGSQGVTDSDLAIAQIAGQPARVVDAGGEATRALARSAANLSPDARNVMQPVLDERYAQQADRVGGFVRALVGNTDSGATRERLGTAAKAANRPAYQAAYDAPAAQQMWHEGFEQLTAAPAVQQAIRGAIKRSQTVAALDGFRPPRNPFVEAADGTLTLRRQPDGSVMTPNLQFWDVVKREIDNQIGTAQRSGANDDARLLTQAKQALVMYLDDAVPAYAQARRGAAAFFDAEDALEAGEKFVRSNVDNRDALRELKRMSPAEKTLFAEGFASRLINDIQSLPDRRDVVNSIFGSPRARQRVEIALGKDKASELEAFLRVENVMTMARNAMGNSTTARQLAELGLAGGTGLATGMLTGDWGTGIAAALATRGARMVKGRVDERVATKVAELLMSDDPAAIRRAVQMVAKSPDLSAAFRSVEDGLARVMAQSAARGSEATGIPALVRSQGVVPARPEAEQ